MDGNHLLKEQEFSYHNYREQNVPTNSRQCTVDRILKPELEQVITREMLGYDSFFLAAKVEEALDHSLQARREADPNDYHA